MPTSARIVITVLLCGFLIGCTSSVGPTEQGAAFLTDTEPQGAQGVIELKDLTAGETPPSGSSVIVGRVGGGQNETFDTQEATFLLSDLGLELKSKEHDGNHDNCKFCQAAKAEELKSMALVRVVDGQGKVIASDAKTLLGLREQQVVVAEGHGQVDEVGTFVFDATKIHIRP